VIAALPGVPQSATLMLLPALNEMFDITSSRAIAGQAHTPLSFFARSPCWRCSVACWPDTVWREKIRSARRCMIGFALINAHDFRHSRPRLSAGRLDPLDYADQALIDMLAGMR
jgi:hypothetical protein